MDDREEELRNAVTELLLEVDKLTGIPYYRARLGLFMCALGARIIGMETMQTIYSDEMDVSDDLNQREEPADDEEISALTCPDCGYVWDGGD